jgi:hypothetical protein
MIFGFALCVLRVTKRPPQECLVASWEYADLDAKQLQLLEGSEVASKHEIQLQSFSPPHNQTHLFQIPS